MKKRIFSTILAVLMVCSIIIGCGSKSGKKEDYPKGAVTITVAYSAGGSSDKLARMVQPYLKEALGTEIVVENQNGAGGQIAAEAVSRGKNDGYQLLAINIPGLYYTVAFQDTTYSYDDFVPVWVESYDPIIMLAMQDAEFNSLGEFAEAAKANPGKYSVGYVSNSGQQATAIWMQENLELDVNMVSYDGGSDASAALLGGHVDVIFSDAYARADIAGEAKALGIGTTEDNTVWPEAVSFNEQLKEYNLEMPSDEFQARMGCYMVSKSFKEDYPDRYDALVDAFKKACAEEDYVEALKNANVYDSMINKAGSEYEDALKTSVDEVKEVVVPLFK